MPEVLGDICSLQGGYAFKSKDFCGEGTPVVKIADVTGGGAMNYSEMQCVSETIAAAANRFETRDSDTLISMTGANVGRITRVWPGEPRALINQRVGRFVPKAPDVFTIDFIHYLVRSQDAYDFFRNAAYGSAQPNISGKLIESLPLPEMGANSPAEIGALLRSLDDKIELNRRMSATLEEMARALYRSWFVDFDPVHARALGQSPAHMDPTTAALFPDSFGPDGLPKGWEAGTLLDLADLNPEKWSKRTHPEAVRYLDLANVKWGAIDNVSDYLWDDAPSRARMVLKPGDTIVGTVRPGNGSYVHINEDGLTGSTGFAVLRPIVAENAALIYCAASSPENIERLTNLADGAAYPAVRPEVVGKTEVALPPGVVGAAYAELATPWLKRCGQLAEEANTLAALRDTLLPHLMSGELRIRETTEKQVEEVV